MNANPQTDTTKIPECLTKKYKYFISDTVQTLAAKRLKRKKEKK